MTDSLSLHSGEYVERYRLKSISRVRKLVRRMRIDSETELADFACGNGMLLQAIGDRKAGYHGVDFSSDFIRAAEEWAQRSGLLNWRFYCQDIVQFCEENPERFDVGAALDFTEHVADADAKKILTAIRHSIRPGGKLYIHTPNRDFFMEVLKERGILKQFPEHIAVRSPAQMHRLLSDAGFDERYITIEKIPHYNVLRFVHPLGGLPFIGRYLQARLWITARA